MQQKECKGKMVTAQEHAAGGLPASASVLLTVSMLKLAKTIDLFGGDRDGLEYKMTKTLFDEMKQTEEKIQESTQVRMQVFGMLYKVRDPTTWTILEQDGPNQLGL